MQNVNLYYKQFFNYKLKSPTSYINFIKKIRNLEDLRYALGLLWFGLTKIVFKKQINNETIRGR